MKLCKNLKKNKNKKKYILIKENSDELCKFIQVKVKVQFCERIQLLEYFEENFQEINRAVSQMKTKNKKTFINRQIIRIFKAIMRE